MPLNSYQKHILSDRRSEERTLGLKFLNLGTGSGYFSSYDAYRKVTYVETSTLFSGAVYTNPYASKQNSEGGFYNLSELVIVASRDYLSNATQKNTKVEYVNTKYRVNRVVDCIDTSEIVLFVSQLE